MKKSEELIRRALLNKKADFDSDKLWDKISQDIVPEQKDNGSTFLYSTIGLILLVAAGLGYYLTMDSATNIMLSANGISIENKSKNKSQKELKNTAQVVGDFDASTQLSTGASTQLSTGKKVEKSEISNSIITKENKLKSINNNLQKNTITAQQNKAKKTNKNTSYNTIIPTTGSTKNKAITNSVKIEKPNNINTFEPISTMTAATKAITPKSYEIINKQSKRSTKKEVDIDNKTISNTITVQTENSVSNSINHSNIKEEIIVQNSISNTVIDTDKKTINSNIKNSVSNTNLSTKNNTTNSIQTRRQTTQITPTLITMTRPIVETKASSVGMIKSFPNDLTLVNTLNGSSRIKMPRWSNLTEPIKRWNNFELQVVIGAGVVNTYSNSFNVFGSFGSWRNTSTQAILEGGLTFSFFFRDRLSLRSGLLIQEKNYRDFISLEQYTHAYNILYNLNNLTIPLVANYHWTDKKWKPFVGAGLYFNVPINAITTACTELSTDPAQMESALICPTINPDNGLSAIFEAGTAFPMFKQKFSLSLLANISFQEAYFSEHYAISTQNQIGYGTSSGSYVNLRLKYHLPLKKK